ncbi:hypothetical protein KIL84_013439 [Mauremys mutica]|uniref:Uncharacterized protein n=1 Tax=Mauremys mutica TaxID=74926 RepID=A0A9D3WR86_9SAUR|nr:hypothetical protein KIL84_013439 [Mauremys mutica]
MCPSHNASSSGNGVTIWSRFPTSPFPPQKRKTLKAASRSGCTRLCMAQELTQEKIKGMFEFKKYINIHVYAHTHAYMHVHTTTPALCVHVEKQPASLGSACIPTLMLLAHSYLWLLSGAWGRLLSCVWRRGCSDLGPVLLEYKDDEWWLL